LSRDAALAAAPEVEIVFGHVARDVFLAASRLRWIQCHGAGMDWMMRVPELAASDVIVTNTRGAHAATIAEHTFGLLIALTRGFPRLWAAQQARAWLRPLGYTPVGLASLTLGIVGFGQIGRALAQRGHAFEMRVIAVDALDVPPSPHVAAIGRLDALPDLLSRSDVVIITAPLIHETYHLIDAPALERMQPSAYLLAVSRGGVVDEVALVAALQAGRLAGAALDVQEQAPVPPDSPLWDVPNLILTPHCSGESAQTTALVTDMFCENLRRYLAGQPLLNLVDKQRGF
jgi:phosphoglycerate dehydrogenase-like enzyme